MDRKQICKIEHEHIYYLAGGEREGKRASSRLSQGGKLNPVEPQDFKALFKKVGVDYKDKT